MAKNPAPPRSQHRHIKSPMPGRLESAPDKTTQFAVSCLKCGREEWCDFGVHGPEFIGEMIEQAGWEKTGSGNRVRYLCDRCAKPAPKAKAKAGAEPEPPADLDALIAEMGLKPFRQDEQDE